jgi:hypothetical protein
MTRSITEAQLALLERVGVSVVALVAEIRRLRGPNVPNECAYCHGALDPVEAYDDGNGYVHPGCTSFARETALTGKELHVRFTSSERHIRNEVISTNRAIWQPETAKTYQCPECLAAIKTQYEYEDLPAIECLRPYGLHSLTWTGPEKRARG